MDMVKCGKCGAEVDQNDLFEDNGIMICEECKMAATKSPSTACGTH